MTRYNVPEQTHNVELKYLGPPDYEIDKYEGYIFGRPTRHPFFFLIVDDSDGTAKMFKRNAIHNNTDPERWLVGECQGVRLYFMDNGMWVLSPQDIYASKDLVDKMAAGAFEKVVK